MEEVRSSILLSSTSRPAARRAVSRSAAARSGCRVRPVDPGNVLPQPLEVVELPSLLLEDVDHDVAVVDPDPLPVGHALDALRSEERSAGEGCVSTFRTRGSATPVPQKYRKNQKKN